MKKISKEEIEKMINACEHPRDRAMVACLYESGTRISELGDIKIKHVKFDQYRAVLIVDGKTGMRRVRDYRKINLNNQKDFEHLVEEEKKSK